MRKAQTIGAWATVRLHDPECEGRVYLSFGDYNEQDNCDEFGVPDDLVFYYTSFIEMTGALSEPTNHVDFTVIDYELVDNDDGR